MIDVALIGAGVMGALHARTIARHPSTRLTRVHDRHPERAGRLAAEHGAAVGPPDGEDLVVVATPASTHVDLVRSLGVRPVLVEKPLARTVEDARRLHGHTRHLFVAQSERHGWDVPTGRPHRISAGRCVLPSGRSLDVDVLADLLVHDVDRLIGWYGLAPEVIEARGRDGRHGLDAAEVLVRWPEGEARIVVDRRAERPARWFAIEGRPLLPLVGDDALTRQLDGVLATLAGREGPVVRYDEAVRALAVCDEVRRLIPRARG